MSTGVERPRKVPKKTSIGNGKTSKSTMKKTKARSYKKYRGQGKG